MKDPLFQALKLKWYEHLKATGFRDIENEKGQLKSKDNRTIGFANQEEISNYFSKMGLFISTHNIPPLHFLIMSRYVEGMYLTEIATKVNRSPRCIRMIVRFYKKKVLSE